jgi:hypothetical protein
MSPFALFVIGVILFFVFAVGLLHTIGIICAIIGLVGCLVYGIGWSRTGTRGHW